MLFSVRGSVQHRNGESHTGEETENGAKLEERETLWTSGQGRFPWREDT